MKMTYPKNALLVLLLVIILSIPAVSYGYNPLTDNPLDQVPEVDYHPTIVLGEAVIIQNTDAYASPLLYLGAYNLMNEPLGMYVNGVVAYRLHRYDGRGASDFVEVAIGGNGLDAGFSGYIDKRNLVYPGKIVPELPSVTLSGFGEEEVALHLDFYADSPIFAAYPNGTKAQLLGYLDDMCHVQIGDQYGFVETSQLQLPPEVAQGLENSMPPQFMALSAVHKHLIEIGVSYEMDLLNEYGSKGNWPLWLKAEYSKMHLTLGLSTGYGNGVYIMPDPDDLQQEEAVSIAAQAACDRFGIPLEALWLAQPEVSVSFFDADRIHTGHYWWIVFDKPLPDGMQPVSIYVSSPAGEIVGF